jgi:site-specific recombinase XerD
MSKSLNRGLVARYLEYCRRERGRSPQTVYKYALSLEALVEHVGSRRLVELGPEDLRGWVHAPMAKRRGAKAVGDAAAPATVKRKVAELRSFYRWLHEVEGLVQRNPALALAAPTVHNENPRPAPEGLWRALWGADLNDDERVAFGLAYFCGLRRHEVTLLAAGHFVDVPERRLAGFKRKGGAKANLPYQSCVRLVEERRPDLIGGSADSFLEPLDRLRAGRVGAATLLPWAQPTPRFKHDAPKGFVDPFQFNRRLGRALVRAGLSERAFTPHQLRHSFCTNLLDMGVPLLAVSRLANHSSVVITQRYLATREDPLADLLHGSGEEPAVPSPWDSVTHG